MSLFIRAELVGASDEQADAIASAARQAARLSIIVDGYASAIAGTSPSVVLAEDGQGGSATSMLREAAAPSGPIWDLRPESAEQLARALEALVRESPLGVVLRASWGGQAAEDEALVSLEAMLGILRRCELRTRTSYTVTYGA